MPERLDGLSAGQIGVLHRLAAGRVQLIEMDLDHSAHLEVLQNRGLTEANRDETGRIVVGLTADGRRLIKGYLDQ